MRCGLAIAASMLVAGCMNTVASLDGGYVRPVADREGHTGAAAHARFGGAGPTGRWALEVALRTKAAPEVKQLGIGTSALAMPFGPRAVIPFARAGIHEVQFEGVDGGFGFGMFSPNAEAGLMIRIREKQYGGGTFLTVGAFTEYDLRFTSQDSGAYWGVTVGIAGLNLIRDPKNPNANPCGGNPCR